MGIRIVGLARLAVSLLMAMVAVGVAIQVRRADALVLVPVVASLVLCGLELPHARIGFALNIVVLLLLAVHPTMGAGVMRWNQAADDERGRLTSTSLGPVGQYDPADVGGAPCTAGDSASVVCLPAPVMALLLVQATTGRGGLCSAHDVWSRVSFVVAARP